MVQSTICICQAKMWRKVFLSIALSFVIIAAQDDILKGLTTCLDNGSELNFCLGEFIETLRPYMSTGLPKYGIPQTEPMFVPRIDFNLNNNAGVDVTVVFTENVITGLSQFELQYIHADVTSVPPTLSMTIAAKRLESKGNYKLAGQAFVELKNSSGSYHSVFDDVVFAGVANLKNDGGVLELEGNPSLDITLGNMNIKFDNLFGGETPELAKLVHEFVNKDPQKFFNDFKQEITKQISVLMGSLIKSSVAGVPPALFNL